MEALGVLLIVFGAVLVLMTWTGTTAQVIDAVFA